ncbi:hypothetical protein [Cellulomonas xiejunii]|uniref:MYXO-CTERM domain-containing protein n=1 Tax=Cellulomonas xiejunii TaxID=2968083 RepID=A0ABY5KQK3_9CELL|nr:hypothetical protein [Cellulomonas xiejunii]MCC2314333.1 hypothetical protein [Cellulomonas xiejunii]MCC2319696.1 hypothetical protein [Cellulomonas xiejunii]UUI71365.1 hypothetical protein NP048_16465 [Cellulomonas xiejunii]
MCWWKPGRGPRAVRWSSLLLVVVCGLVVLVCVGAALRGRPVALVPAAVAAALALREVRRLRRARRPG